MFTVQTTHTHTRVAGDDETHLQFLHTDTADCRQISQRRSMMISLLYCVSHEQKKTLRTKGEISFIECIATHTELCQCVNKKKYIYKRQTNERKKK